MKWSIALSHDANAFLERSTVTEEEVFDCIRKSLLKFNGENVNVDVKKLKGAWAGFHRIRKGKMRIIAEFNFDSRSVLIEQIDWRGSVYRK